jgi:hypothetical protein
MTSKLQKVRTIAKKKNIKNEINISTRKNKKFMVRSPKGKLLHFGALGMEDFLDHKDEERKKRFHARFRSNSGYDNPESGLYYSVRLLW